jgi:hypothetical protein
MRANACQANQWNQSQERPPRDAAAGRWYFTTIANCALDGVLIKNLYVALGLLRSDCGSGIQRGGNV